MGESGRQRALPVSAVSQLSSAQINLVPERPILGWHVLLPVTLEVLVMALSTQYALLPGSHYYNVCYHKCFPAPALHINKASSDIYAH